MMTGADLSGLVREWYKLLFVDPLQLRPMTLRMTARAQLERDADGRTTIIVERVRGRKVS
jgi:hypothetical protein